MPYIELKKCLSETFNPSLVEPICNHFTSKYNIKQIIPTGFKREYGIGCGGGTIGEPNGDIMFFHFNFLKINNNYKQAFENTTKLLNIFLDLIIFIRPDVDEQVNHKNFKEQQKEEKARLERLEQEEKQEKERKIQEEKQLQRDVHMFNAKDIPLFINGVEKIGENSASYNNGIWTHNYHWETKSNIKFTFDLAMFMWIKKCNMNELFTIYKKLTGDKIKRS